MVTSLWDLPHSPPAMEAGSIHKLGRPIVQLDSQLPVYQNRGRARATFNFNAGTVKRGRRLLFSTWKLGIMAKRALSILKGTVIRHILGTSLAWFNRSRPIDGVYVQTSLISMFIRYSYIPYMAVNSPGSVFVQCTVSDQSKSCWFSYISTQELCWSILNAHWCNFFCQLSLP